MWHQFHFFKQEFILLNFDLVLAVTIGAVLMTAMGQVAVQLSHSTNHLLDLKKSKFYCSERKYFCKNSAVYAIFAIFISASLAFLIWSSV
jgi:hypothetical protein